MPYTEIFDWIVITCINCNLDFDLRDWHWQYHMGKRELQARCPNCEILIKVSFKYEVTE
jgi:hypothetical protein